MVTNARWNYMLLKPQVVGSNPTGPTFDAAVAQW